MEDPNDTFSRLFKEISDVMDRIESMLRFNALIVILYGLLLPFEFIDTVIKVFLFIAIFFHGATFGSFFLKYKELKSLRKQIVAQYNKENEIYE